MTPSEQKILRALHSLGGGTASHTELAEESGVPYANLSRVLKRMEKEGLVWVVRRGTYKVTLIKDAEQVRTTHMKRRSFTIVEKREIAEDYLRMCKTHTEQTAMSFVVSRYGVSKNSVRSWTSAYTKGFLPKEFGNLTRLSTRRKQDVINGTMRPCQDIARVKVARDEYEAAMELFFEAQEKLFGMINEIIGGGIDGSEEEEQVSLDAADQADRR